MKFDEDEIQWWISEENMGARQWINKLDELKEIEINDITITRVDGIWDGPLVGAARYKETDYYFVALFDNESPSLNLNVGRCYLLLNITDELRQGIGIESVYEKEPNLDYSNPVGYFFSSLAYFMTHPERFSTN